VANKDTYPSFGALALSETEGNDFIVTCLHNARDDIVILAPHGGKIEPGTSELARAVAGSDFALYLFEGLKPSGNRALHVTSTNFDEPRAMAMTGAALHAIGIHGLAADNEEIEVGGLDDRLRDLVNASLLEAGFLSRVVTSGPYAARDPANICNRAKSGGVQLEIGRALRDKIRADAGVRTAAAEAVRKALESIVRRS
jgi:phage replication-related protein YjqB (UPF0714/DUF867 family)